MVHSKGRQPAGLWRILNRTEHRSWNGIACFVMGFLCALSWIWYFDGITKSWIGRGANPQTVLVTGGLGFIGSHVVEELVLHGYRVLVFDDMSNGNNFDAVRNSTGILLKDITKTEDFDAITMQIDYVVHLAAAISVVESLVDPEKYHRINVNGSLHLLEWARKNKVKRFVAASTSSIYGDATDADMPLKEHAASGGISPYAASKYQMEKLLEEYAYKGLPTTALRIFNVYGPRQDPSSPHSGVVSYFMHQAALGSAGRLQISGSGKQFRDFIYVKDVAIAVRYALESEDVNYESYNVCTGVKTTINDLAREILTSCSSTATIEHHKERPADVLASVCDPEKARRKLGFIASTSFQRGISATWNWYQYRRRTA